MAYRNVKVQHKAMSVNVVRYGNGFTVEPEYEDSSYKDKGENALVFTGLQAALNAAKKMLEKGREAEAEEWVDEPRSRTAKSPSPY